MNNEILINLSKIAIVLLSLAAIIHIVWHNFSKKAHPAYHLLLALILLVLSLWALLDNSLPTSFITIFAQILLLILLQNIAKRSSVKNALPQFDQAQLIRCAQEQERSRIYANLHDDVGAKLLELVYTAQDDKTKTLAKDILNQMRQAVAQTQNIQCTAVELMQSICDEATMRLHASHITLNCENQLNNHATKFTGVVPNVIERISREVISNIIKHAKATDVTMIFTSHATAFSLIISDNGIGMEEKNNGKGLKTIEKRATKIKAQTNWHSQANKGTQFTLTYHYDD